MIESLPLENASFDGMSLTPIRPGPHLVPLNLIGADLQVKWNRFFSFDQNKIILQRHDWQIDSFLIRMLWCDISKCLRLRRWKNINLAFDFSQCPKLSKRVLKSLGFQIHKNMAKTKFKKLTFYFYENDSITTQGLKTLGRFVNQSIGKSPRLSLGFIR